MDFLKAIFGEKPLTFEELVQAINAHNGNEANKDNQIKIGNLGGGDYVGKAKYDSEIEKLNNIISGKDTEITTANDLIAELKKASKGNEDFQTKITGYETQVADLQKENAKIKMDSELKIAMLAAGAKTDDIDYLIYKLNSKGEKLELGDDGHIKGVDEMIAGLKTQHPNQFESQQQRKVDPNRLPDPNKNTGLTKAEILRKPYAERMKIYEENPEAYNEAMKS